MEQNGQVVLILPPFWKYLRKSLLQFLFRLLIIISSVMMVTITPGVIWCPYSLIVYGAAPLLSIVFSAILMICDFIVPCVINKKVLILINLFSILTCSMMILYFVVITILPLLSNNCLYYLTSDLNYQQLAHGFYTSTIICLAGWTTSGVVSAAQLTVSW